MSLKSIIQRIATKEYLFDVLFWIFFLSIFVIAVHKFEPVFESFKVGLAIIIPVILPVYIHLFIFKKFLIQKKRRAVYFISLIAIIGLFGYINLPIGRFISGNPNAESNTYVVVGVFIGVYTGLKYLKKIIIQQIQIQKEQARASQAESKQVQAELNMLKLQINPHFLFNTLNNIYAMALDKSDDLPDVVLKLSRIMRYVLDSSKIKFVNLEKEIGFIEDYIDLERIRLNIPSQINIQKNGTFAGKVISPLILITFIENSFKHGINSQSKHFDLNIEITCNEDILTFIVTNTVPPKIDKGDISGVGLENTRRRLQLLYQDRHSIEVKQDTESFRVKLTLDLKS